MKRTFLFLASLPLWCGAASAQTAKPAPAAIVVRTTATAPAPLPATSAPFGCDARAPGVCYFRIFYTRGDRVVILPASIRNDVPGVTIGGNYCMTLGKAPLYRCARKTINAKYNS